jgi:hypothetical protein
LNDEELRQLSEYDRNFYASHGEAMYLKMIELRNKQKVKPQKLEPEDQKIDEWTKETSERLKKVVAKEWRLNKIVERKILHRQQEILENEMKSKIQDIEESYSVLKTELSTEMNRAIKERIKELNGQKVRLNLAFNAQIQSNLSKFLKPIEDACLALSTRQTEIVTLTFMVDKNNKVKLVVRYD